MSEAHPTTTPEQLETDTFAVFRSLPGESNLHLIERVDVPRYDEPTADGEKLSQSTRKKLAVMHAVESDETFIGDGAGWTQEPNEVDGEEFMVMYDLQEAMDFVVYKFDKSLRQTWANHGEEL